MIPSEINFGEVYLPPILIVGALSLLLAWLTSVALNKLRWSRYFTAPTGVFLSVTALYAVILGTFVIPM